MGLFLYLTRTPLGPYCQKNVAEGGGNIYKGVMTI